MWSLFSVSDIEYDVLISAFQSSEFSKWVRPHYKKTVNTMRPPHTMPWCAKEKEIYFTQEARAATIDNEEVTLKL